MTTPRPHGGQFTTPPQIPVDGFTLDADNLPVVPSPPRAVMAGLACMALAAAIVLLGSVWRVLWLVLADQDADGTRARTLGDLIIVSAIVIAVLVLMGFNIWRGRSTAVYFTLVISAWAILRLLSAAGKVVVNVASGESPLADTGAPVDIAGMVIYLLALACAIPVFVALVWPGSLHWAQKANAIRAMRERVKRGLPVYQLPPHLRV